MDFNLALELVAKAAQAEGKQAGILVRNLSEIDKLKSLGYTALAIGSDLAALRNGYKPFIIER